MAVLRLPDSFASRDLSVSVLLLAALAVWAAYRVVTVLYRILFSPVRHIPGPLSSRITGFGDWANFLVGRRSAWIAGLHDRYGPVVLISPILVSVSDATSAKTICAVGRLLCSRELRLA
jgi:hypothetical protein